MLPVTWAESLFSISYLFMLFVDTYNASLFVLQGPIWLGKYAVGHDYDYEAFLQAYENGTVTYAYPLYDQWIHQILTTLEKKRYYTELLRFDTLLRNDFKFDGEKIVS